MSNSTINTRKKLNWETQYSLSSRVTISGTRQKYARWRGAISTKFDTQPEDDEAEVLIEGWGFLDSPASSAFRMTVEFLFGWEWSLIDGRERGGIGTEEAALVSLAVLFSRKRISSYSSCFRLGFSSRVPSSSGGWSQLSRVLVSKRLGLSKLGSSHLCRI